MTPKEIRARAEAWGNVGFRNEDWWLAMAELCERLDGLNDRLRYLNVDLVEGLTSLCNALTSKGASSE